MKIVVWVNIVMACLQGWTSRSIAMWTELTGYRLDKAFHCNSRDENEFVIYEFTNNEKHKLEFRVARGREDNMRVSPFSSESSLYLAVHTITRINGHPPLSKVLRTITFKGDRATHPSFWDVMILTNVVHNDSPIYVLDGRHWFAGIIFGLIEKWAMIYNNEATTTDEKNKPRRGRHVKPTGNWDVVRPAQINTIWVDFMEVRQIVGKQVG